MEKASISSLKNRLSAYLRKVRAGHSIIIYDRDVAIARIDRIEDRGQPNDLLTKLRAEGVTKPAVKKLTSKQRLALCNPGVSDAGLLEALREDRDIDR